MNKWLSKFQRKEMSAHDAVIQYLQEEALKCEKDADGAFIFRYDAILPELGNFFDEFAYEAAETHPFQLRAVTEHPGVTAAQLWLAHYSEDGPEAIAEQLYTFIVSAFQRASFVKAGKKRFQVSPGLSDQLLHTELRGLSCDDLKLPYESVYVECPNTPDFRLSTNIPLDKLVSGVCITLDPKLHLDKDGNQQQPAWRILIQNGIKGGDDRDNFLMMFTISLLKDTPLQQAIDKLTAPKDDPDPQGVEASSRRIFLWALNVMLYATMEGAEREDFVSNDVARLKELMERTSNPKKKKQFAAQLKKLNTQPVILLGRSVPYEREAPTQTGRKQTVMTRVRGHYHHYLTGVGRTVRIRKWIQPFWRGPEGAPITSTTHLLKVAKEIETPPVV